jgi:major type 1 subunit fimbrin (pilin)
MDLNMKNSIVNLSLMAVLGMTAVTAQAASSGTINFNGELTDTTCDVSLDGQGADATYTLPTVSVNELAVAGATSSRTSFTMDLSKCNVGTVNGKSKVAAYFQAGSTIDPSTGRLKNTTETGAQLVDLQLLDGQNNFSAINAGSSEQTTKTTFKDINSADGTAKLVYGVQYYANGKTTPGVVTSSVVYNLQYK